MNACQPPEWPVWVNWIFGLILLAIFVFWGWLGRSAIRGNEAKKEER